jgi:putative transposase
MARRPRVYVPELSVHVHHRGINFGAIVATDRDYDRLLRLIAKAAARHGVSIHAFAIMKTHYHLIATPTSDGALAKAMQAIGIRHTHYFNRQYGRIGTIWNDRYCAHLIDSPHYWYNCFRYVELNPLAARIVDAAEAYRWTSYRVHAYGERCDWLVPHPLYTALGHTPQARQAAYRRLCQTPLNDAELTLILRPRPIDVAQWASSASDGDGDCDGDGTSSSVLGVSQSSIEVRATSS